MQIFLGAVDAPASDVHCISLQDIARWRLVVVASGDSRTTEVPVDIRASIADARQIPCSRSVNEAFRAVVCVALTNFATAFLKVCVNTGMIITQNLAGVVEVNVTCGTNSGDACSSSLGTSLHVVVGARGVGTIELRSQNLEDSSMSAHLGPSLVRRALGGNLIVIACGNR